MSDVIKSNVMFLKTGSERLSELHNFELVGRDEDLARLSTILLRKKSNSVLVFGQGGVGVSALVLGLQASKKKKDTPFSIVAKRLLWLDTDGLFQSGNAEEINGYFNKIIHTLNRTPESILIIEDARNFVDACSRSGCMHFINALTSTIKNQKTQAILEARDTDLEFLHGIHSDIKDNFATLALGEPEGEVLHKIVSTLANGLSTHHHIKISPDAINTAIKVTTENRSKETNLNRAQPERAMTLLDFAMSAYVLKANQEPSDPIEKDAWLKKQETLKSLHERHRMAEIDLIKAEYDLIEEQTIEKNKTTKSIDEVAANIAIGGYKTNKIKSMEEDLDLKQRLVDEIKGNIDKILSADYAKLELTSDHIYTQYSKMTNIPISVLKSDERVVMRDLDNIIRNSIYGQDSQVNRLADIVRVATYGRRRADEPGAALCLGPSGVGKTEVWKVIAKILGRPLFIFDMSEYGEKNAAARLVGAVPGYELAGIGGQLTNAVLEYPYGIFLFDEIEKAHENLFNIFLQVLSDGRLTDNTGRRCSFKKALVGFTSNIGQPRFLDTSLNQDEKLALATEDLNKTFKSEFLNRFGGRENIIWFNSLGTDSLVKIVKREFAGINDAYSSKGIITNISDADIDAFVTDQYDPVRGARGLPGVINKTVDSIIINEQLNNPNISGTLNVVYNRETKSLTASMK